MPEQVARHFADKDGTAGGLVYLTPMPGRSVWDGHYLIDWAEPIRETKLPDHSVVKGSGRTVIFADMILNVVEVDGGGAGGRRVRGGGAGGRVAPGPSGCACL